MKFKNLAEFAAHLRTIHNRTLKLCYVSILQLVGEEAKKEAQDRIIGRIRPLESVWLFNAWEPLKDSTIAQKARKGWGKDGDPRSILWATGMLDRSIVYRVEKGKLRVIVGTNIDYAGYLEYGTVHMAPRPFMGPAMIITMNRLQPRIARMFWLTLRGRRIQ